MVPFYYYSCSSRWQRSLKPLLEEERDRCWWPGDAMHKGFSCDGVNLIFPVFQHQKGEMRGWGRVGGSEWGICCGGGRGEWGIEGGVQYRIWRLIVITRKVLEAWDQWVEFSNSFDIWQASRQHCCRGAFQMSKRYGHFDTRSGAFKTLWDLTMRRLMRYWIWALLVPNTCGHYHACKYFGNLGLRHQLAQWLL